MADGTGSNIDARDAKIGELLSELHERKLRGESLNEEEILAAHPDLASNLPRYLAVIGELRQAESSVRGLIDRGVLALADGSDQEGHLGTYRTAEYVGRGGMGIVLKAVDENLNRVVAIKILRPDLATDESTVARFRREAKAAAALRHPNAVAVYAFGHEHGTSFLVMEYVDGPNLAEVIRAHGPLPTNTIRTLFGQLLAGLAAAHGAGLVHRDITPSNLLLEGWPLAVRRGRVKGGSACVDHPSHHDDADPGATQTAVAFLPDDVPHVTLKIADFGLARLLTAETHLTLPQSALGTPEYMSPEQARGDDNIDRRSDLYSAGVVLYEMLTGRTPFRADTPTAVLHRILREDPADPRRANKSADPALCSLALRLMAKRAEDRFTSAGEVAAALESGRRVKVRSERRRRLLPRVIGVCGATALAAAAWLWTNRQAALVPGAADLTISQVRPSPASFNVVEVQYGTSTEWKAFHRFAESVRVTGAVPVDVDGSGRRLVAATTDPLVRDSGFFLFNCDESDVWELNLTSDLPWPDCNPTVGWGCPALAVGDLDGKPGDEIAVVASDRFEYPTRISILDPRARTILATFWHLGDIGADENTIWIEADFFGPGLPAIIVQGVNNKLDGFYETRSDDPPPLTKHPIVPTMAILDPRKMLEEKEGLGPPACSRISIRPSQAIYAYAFLNLSFTDKAEQRPGAATPPEHPKPEEQGGMLVRPAYMAASDGREARFFANLKHRQLDTDVTLELDRNLNVLRVRQHPEATTQRPEEYWRSLWKVVIQDYDYIKQSRAEGDSASKP